MRPRADPDIFAKGQNHWEPKSLILTGFSKLVASGHGARRPLKAGLGLVLLCYSFSLALRLPDSISALPHSSPLLPTPGPRNPAIPRRSSPRPASQSPPSLLEQRRHKFNMPRVGNAKARVTAFTAIFAYRPNPQNLWGRPVMDFSWGNLQQPPHLSLHSLSPWQPRASFKTDFPQGKAHCEKG